MKIHPEEYVEDFLEHTKENFSENLLKQRGYLLRDLEEYSEENNIVLDTRDTVKSADELKDFLRDDSTLEPHGNNVYAVRKFLDYIGKQLARIEAHQGNNSTLRLQ